MGIALKLSDGATLLSLAPGKKFLCLVTLLAVRNGADRLRFLRRSGAWSISAGSGEDWEDYVPLDAAVDLSCIVRDVSRPRGLTGRAPLSSGEFALRLSGGTTVRCVASESNGGEIIILSLLPSGPAADRAAELIDCFLRLRRDRDGRRTA